MFTEYKRSYISRKNIKIFTRKNLSAKKMVALLEDGIRYRSFTDILSEICETRELIDRLCMDSGQSRETVRKRVYYWSKGTFYPKREEVFQICFVLELSLEQADKLLLSISEMGIHYRNPVELIYAYGLKQGMNWQEVVRLRDRLMELYKKEEKADQTEERSSFFTKHMEIAFHDVVHSEEELEHFLLSRAADLGKLRKTVYQDFVKMINLLQKGESEARKLSIEELTDTYIATLPQRNGQKKELIKVIQRNWPSKDKLYKMLQKSKNVNRKTMLLLFLITEEFMGDELNRPGDSGVESKFPLFDAMEDLTANECLQIRIQAMNLYLDSYGMNRLDLGNPFDCMVLYALKAGYEEGMSDRFRDVLHRL